MRKAIMILSISLAVLSFCSKDRSAAPDAPGASTPSDSSGAQSGVADTSDSQAGPEQKQPQDALNMTDEPVLRIQAVALLPEAPTVLDDVTAKPVLAGPGRENTDFRYQWFVNGKEVMGGFGAILEKTNFKKGAWLYCRVQAYSENDESEWFKSDAIRVLNSLPVLRMPPLEEFDIPGEIFYQAAASDADNDALTFELLAPKEQGIVIDPKTGALSWKIDADTVGRLGETIEIQLAVSDGDGEKIIGKITLSLTSTKQTAPQ